REAHSLFRGADRFLLAAELAQRDGAQPVRPFLLRRQQDGLGRGVERLFRPVQCDVSVCKQAVQVCVLGGRGERLEQNPECVSRAADADQAARGLRLRAHTIRFWRMYVSRSSYAPPSLANSASLRAVSNQARVLGLTSFNAARKSAI